MAEDTIAQVGSWGEGGGAEQPFRESKAGQGTPDVGKNASGASGLALW